MERYDVGVIGGGISGISSLYYLQKENKNANFILFEAEKSLGGKIRTKKEKGIIYELGPDSLFSYKRYSVDFLNEIGFSNSIKGSKEGLGIYLYTDNKLLRYPNGIFSLYPADILDFFKSNLFSWYGKVRFLWEAFIPPISNDKDESLYEFGIRRLGKEATQKLIAPLLGGIYAGDPMTMSLKALFPHYRLMEKKYKSIIKAMLYNIKITKERNKISPFITVKGGLYQIIERLKKFLEKTKILFEEEVKEVRKEKNGFIIISKNHEVWVKALIVSTELFKAHSFLRFVDDDFNILKAIPYTNTAVIIMGFHDEPIYDNISGFLVDTEREKEIHITGSTFISYKWEKITPWNGFWIRCFIGSAKNDSVVELPDDKLIEIAISDFTKIVKMHTNPQIVKLYKWTKAMPQYEIGHIEKVKEIEKILLQNKGIFIASAGYKGIGIPDCIKQGNETAKLVNEYLKK